MSTENNEQIKEQENLSKEPQQIENTDNQPKTRITEEIKNLLDSLLKNTLDKRIIRLQKRNEEQNKNIKIIKDNFEKFNSKLKSLVKNMEETLKKKEAKKKEELPRRLKLSKTKHSLASKSVPPGKKLKSSRSEYNTSRNKEKSININTSNYKAEETFDRQTHNRDKSFREKRKMSESNMKKGKIKLEKKTDNNIFSPYRKDDNKEDIKSKTMSNFNTEKKIESKRNLNNISINKGKIKKDLNDKKKDNLSKTFSEEDLKAKTKKAK